MNGTALKDLTKLADLSREAFALGLRLGVLAEEVEGTIDSLAAKAGVSVEDVYRALHENERADAEAAPGEGSATHSTSKDR